MFSGTIKSIDTEIIQQAPFLPLTKAVYEAIVALNSNSLPSGQKEVFEYLAHTYQYVHVPKPNVIRDSLGILFKEGKVYATEDNQYFVHSESDRIDGEKKNSGGEKKDVQTPNLTEKLKEKPRQRCFLCEEEKGSSSPNAQGKQRSRNVDHAHLCEKHKHGLKPVGRRSRESSSRDTSMESKDIKHEKEKKTSSTNDKDSKKTPKDKSAKKTVWGQLTGFMRGKSQETTKGNSSKSVNEDKKIVETASVVPPTKTTGATTAFDDSFKESQNDERMTPLGASLNEKQIEQSFQRSRSFNTHTKKRPELARSNSFSSNSTKKKAIDYDMEPQKNENILRSTVNYNEHVRPSSSSVAQSFTASRTVQSTPEPMAQRNNPCAVGVVRPYTQANHSEGRNVSRSNSLKDTRKVMTSTSPTPTKDLQRSGYRADSRQSGSLASSSEMHRMFQGGSKNFASSTPTGDMQRRVSSDSNRPSSGTLTNDLQRYRDSRTSSSTLTSGGYTPVFRDTKVMGSLTTPNDFERPLMRDPRSVTRSLSLREHRHSDITPYSSHRTHVNVHRELLGSDSPLKHLLTKNTGNTLPVTPNHIKQIPGTTIQDRSRPSMQNRNSFPNNTSIQRTSWRTMSKDCHDDDGIGATAKGLLIDENLKKHDHLFSPIYLQQNQRMLPCDCSETGYSETSCSKVMSDSTEHKSVSSEYYQSSFLKKYHNENLSSKCSTSDNGILLDEISSSCSSEIQSIMNHDNKMHTQQSPYTVAKGEVVLDSSLTFIGII